MDHATAVLFSVDLAHPIPIGKDNLLERLDFRRHTLGDLIELEKVVGKLEAFAVLVSRLTGTAMPFVKRLDNDDVQEIMVKLGPFYGAAPSDGSSPDSE